MHTNHVYKRRKIRNSVALLSEGGGCSSGLNFGCSTWERYSIPSLSLDTSTSSTPLRWKSLSVNHENLRKSSSNSEKPTHNSSSEHNRGLAQESCSPDEIKVETDDSSWFLCKLCGLKGSPEKMLICDLCEEAWHLNCCNETKVPLDQWCCQPCSNNGLSASPSSLAERFFWLMSEKKRRKMLRETQGPILYMLMDEDLHTSRVRVGKDFQAKVPGWEGPAVEDDEYFSNSLELSPTELDNLKCWSRFSCSGSSSNWLQCRGKIMLTAEVGKRGILCGKWRRAPASMTPTEDWDCSCAVLWDPARADCAVPQELETSEVLRQLKCPKPINQLRQ
ncbi:RING/FYVE/PHD zinc finger superfamily protein isoform X2 [Wolffia australiana]